MFWTFTLSFGENMLATVWATFFQSFGEFFPNPLVTLAMITFG
jgi:hypothetical protein